LLKEKFAGREGLAAFAAIFITVVVPETDTLEKFKPTPAEEPVWAKASSWTSNPGGVTSL
jgi:hypothetical protein